MAGRPPAHQIEFEQINQQIRTLSTLCQDLEEHQPLTEPLQYHEESTNKSCPSDLARLLVRSPSGAVAVGAFVTANGLDVSVCETADMDSNAMTLDQPSRELPGDIHNRDWTMDKVAHFVCSYAGASPSFPFQDHVQIMARLWQDIVRAHAKGSRQEKPAVVERRLMYYALGMSASATNAFFKNAGPAGPDGYPFTLDKLEHPVETAFSQGPRSLDAPTGRYHWSVARDLADIALCIVRRAKAPCGVVPIQAHIVREIERGFLSEDGFRVFHAILAAAFMDARDSVDGFCKAVTVHAKDSRDGVEAKPSKADTAKLLDQTIHSQLLLLKLLDSCAILAESYFRILNTLRNGRRFRDGVPWWQSWGSLCHTWMKSCCRQVDAVGNVLDVVRSKRPKYKLLRGLRWEDITVLESGLVGTRLETYEKTIDNLFDNKFVADTYVSLESVVKCKMYLSKLLADGSKFKRIHDPNFHGNIHCEAVLAVKFLDQISKGRIPKWGFSNPQCFICTTLLTQIRHKYGSVSNLVPAFTTRIQATALPEDCPLDIARPVLSELKKIVLKRIVNAEATLRVLYKDMLERERILSGEESWRDECVFKGKSPRQLLKGLTLWGENEESESESGSEDEEADGEV